MTPQRRNSGASVMTFTRLQRRKHYVSVATVKRGIMRFPLRTVPSVRFAPSVMAWGYVRKASCGLFCLPTLAQNPHMAVVTAISLWHKNVNSWVFEQPFLPCRCVREESGDDRNFQMAISTLAWTSVWSVIWPMFAYCMWNIGLLHKKYIALLCQSSVTAWPKLAHSVWC
jgi:hypothetical protein